MVAVVLVGLVVGLLLYLALAAAFLRAAVTLANICLGAPSASTAGENDDDTDDEGHDEDEEAGEAADQNSSQPDQTTSGVPMPGLGRAALVALVTVLANSALAVVFGFSMGLFTTRRGGTPRADDGFARVMLPLISLVVGFFASAAVRSGLLPTSFERASLVTLFEYLMGLAAVGGVAAIVIGASGGPR